MRTILAFVVVIVVLAVSVLLWVAHPVAQEVPPPVSVVPQDAWALVVQNQSVLAFAEFQKAMRINEGVRIQVDPTLGQKGGRITEQWDQQIKAPAATTLAAWDAHLRAFWPAAMARIAQRMKECGCTLMGVREGFAETSVQRIYGPERALAFRFTRSSTTITVHIDVLAGK
jgi:hypothetical protein